MIRQVVGNSRDPLDTELEALCSVFDCNRGDDLDTVSATCWTRSALPPNANAIRTNLNLF